MVYCFSFSVHTSVFVDDLAHTCIWSAWVRMRGKFSWHIQEAMDFIWELINSDWRGVIVLFKFKDNLIVKGDLGEEMKAYSANWRLFAMGFQSPRESFSELNLLTAAFFICPLVGRGEKNMFTISAACAVDDTLIRYIFEPSKQNIHCRRKQSLMVNNWFNTV